MPVSSLLVNLGFVALAGVLYGLLLRRLVNIGIGEPKSAPKVLLSGGFRAVLATAASFQARYIAMGVVLAQEGVRQVHGSTFTTSFLISMLPIETYGVIDIIYSVVPAFACGFLATWFLPKILRRAAL